MAVLFDPLFQAVNPSGAPYAGAKLNFYRAGTTSRVTVFKNAAGSTPHTNPVTADSAGIFAPIYLDTTYPLKAILQSAAGVTILTIERFDPAPGGVTGNSYTVETAADLPVPSNEFAEGIVLNDPDPAKNGYYYREAAAWVFARGFPDTLARMTVTGGTANDIAASTLPGVDPANISMLWIEAPADNTGPVTINGRPVLTIDGAALLAGQWLSGRTYWFTDEGDHYKLRTESDVSGLVAQAEAAATAALGASGAAAGAAGAAATSANEAAGYAAGLNIAPIAPGDAGKILQVNEGEDGSDWVEPPNPITDGDKGDIEVTGGGAVWALSPNIKALMPASPSQFGGDVAAALAAANWLHIDGNYVIPSEIVLTKPFLKITSVEGATLTYTGSAGADYAIRLNDVEHLDLQGPLTINCAGKAASGLHVRAVNGAKLVKIDGATVVAPFMASPATAGADGIFVQCDSGRGEVLSITRCTVKNVNRSVSGGTCCGITANDFKVMTVTDNIVDGVFKGAGTVDADGIKVFSQLTGSDYEDALVAIERNTVINCEGRFVKTQTRGKTSIRNNIFRISQAIALQESYNAVDCQVDGATIEDNFFDLRTAWTGGGTLILFFLRVPATNPTYSGQQIFGAVRNNKAIIATAAPDISRFVYLDFAGISSRAYSVAIEVEGNFATTTSGWGAASIGTYFGTISAPVSWAAGATAKVSIRNNDIDVSNWLQSLGASGGTAAHNGLGDLSSKLILEVSNNKCPRATALPVMEYTSNACFTSNISVWGNSVGTQANRWDPPFDFAKILGGCDFYLASATTPPHLNNPSSYTFSQVSRKGLHLLVDMYGGIKGNRAMSLTAIGATPSWA